MNDLHLHEHRLSGEPDRLRSVERLALLELERVVAVSLKGLTVKTMLDVGTGTGVFAEAFAKLVPDVTGIDLIVDLLAVARGYIPGAHFQGASAEAIPFENGTFDLVFLGHVLHETGDALKALEEARRVARSRVVALEWPYRQEKPGPPLEDRLKPDVIVDLAGTAGFRTVENISLAHMVLYRLTP